MLKTNNFIKYSYLEKISWRKEFKGRLQSVRGTALAPKELTGKQPLEVILSSGSKDFSMELNSFLLLSLFTPILSYCTLLTIYSGIYRKMKTIESQIKVKTNRLSSVAQNKNFRIEKTGSRGLSTERAWKKVRKNV